MDQSPVGDLSFVLQTSPVYKIRQRQTQPRQVSPKTGPSLLFAVIRAEAEHTIYAGML